jgi:hypothetical protein
MYKVLLGILGVPLALFVGILFMIFWHNVVLGAPKGGTAAAPWGDWESPILGLICTGIGLIVWPILGVLLGSRLDSRMRNPAEVDGTEPRS